MLARVGRSSAARELIEHALTIDPLGTATNSNASIIYAQLGQFERALRYEARARELGHPRAFLPSAEDALRRGDPLAWAQNMAILTGRPVESFSRPSGAVCSNRQRTLPPWPP